MVERKGSLRYVPKIQDCRALSRHGARFSVSSSLHRTQWASRRICNVCASPQFQSFSEHLRAPPRTRGSVDGMKNFPNFIWSAAEGRVTRSYHISLWAETSSSAATVVRFAPCVDGSVLARALLT